ncbi:hypothetical protein DFAR_800011 [Desulfarculales bacterium]
MDEAPSLTPAPESSPILHPNIRGAGYFLTAQGGSHANFNPILDKLRALGLEGMLKALEEQLNIPEAQALGFEERLGLMVDREAIHRENRRLKNRLAKAKLRHDACLEDIDYRHRRGMDKSRIMALAL